MMSWVYCFDNDGLIDSETTSNCFNYDCLSNSKASSGNKSLQPRQLFWEFELESCEHTKRNLPSIVGLDDGGDNISVLTAEVVLDSYNSSHVEFVLEPCALEEAIRANCFRTEAANSPQKDTRWTGLHQSVMGLDCLPLCAEKYGTCCCPCVAMSHLSSPDYQQDIRKALYLIGELGGHEMADQFLLSMLVEEEVTSNVARVAFAIPGLFHDGDDFGCRKFLLCRQQFRNLFGLTEDKVSELEATKLKRKLLGSMHTDMPFQWSPFFTSYKVGARTYNCSCDSDDACY